MGGKPITVVYALVTSEKERCVAARIALSCKSFDLRFSQGVVTTTMVATLEAAVFVVKSFPPITNQDSTPFTLPRRSSILATAASVRSRDAPSGKRTGTKYAA